jgi:hypothetical protein
MRQAEIMGKILWLELRGCGDLGKVLAWGYNDKMVRGFH